MSYNPVEYALTVLNMVADGRSVDYDGNPIQRQAADAARELEALPKDGSTHTITLNDDQLADLIEMLEWAETEAFDIFQIVSTDEERDCFEERHMRAYNLVVLIRSLIAEKEVE